MSLHQAPAPYPFQRTACACRLCTINCEHMPGALAPRDVAVIASHLGATDTLAFARTHLLASDGPRLQLADGRVISLPTLVPAAYESGACRFLKGGRCTIHAVSPFGCAQIDAHMPEEEFRRRADTLYAEILNDRQQQGPYTLLIESLRASGRQAPPLALRKARLSEAIRRESGA